MTPATEAYIYTQTGVRCCRFLMNAKLFVAMGLPWAIDVVSDFLVEPKWLWYVPEALLSLQGVFIFCIFVLKRKVLHRLRKRVSALCGAYCCCCTCCRRRRGPEGASAPIRESTLVAARRAGGPPKNVHKSASSSTLCTVSASDGLAHSLRHSPSPSRGGGRAER